MQMILREELLLLQVMEMWIYFKKQTNWTQLQFIYLFMAAPCGIRDLSSRAGIEPSPPAVEAWSLIK